VRDLYLTDLRAVLIVDDKDIEAVLTMLHYIRGDNQDVGSDARLLPGVDEIALSMRQWPRTGAFAGADRRISRCRQLSRPPRTDTPGNQSETGAGKTERCRCRSTKSPRLPHSVMRPNYRCKTKHSMPTVALALRGSFPALQCGRLASAVMDWRGKLDLLQARVIDPRSSNRQRSASEPMFAAFLGLTPKQNSPGSR
jgi:hypothetical protein